MIRLDGYFGNMRVRSERPQSAPYRPLAKVMETDQTLFTHKDIRDTVVGLYCPVYMNQVNTPGWHLHFLSEDRTLGGHVFDMRLRSGTARVDKICNMELELPREAAFDTYALKQDLQAEIKSVE